ncbi:MAG: hypothetical protein HC854_14505 [Flavobacterium sp.]|nr:hypothetical protein [Flavobacterium sp.]
MLTKHIHSFLTPTIILLLFCCSSHVFGQKSKNFNDPNADELLNLSIQSINALEIDKGLNYAEDLLNYSLKIKNHYFISKAYNQIAICNEELNDLKKAEIYYLKAIDYAKLTNDNILLNYVYTNIANLYYFIKLITKKQ